VIKLRVVGASADNEKLILSNKPRGKHGSHVLAIDRRLVGVLEDVFDERRKARKDLVELPVRSRSKFSPPEIQRQLRAGLPPDQVATAAGVDVDYVERFYQPVLYERVEIINDAQALFVEKQRLGMSALSLGDSVEMNLRARRVVLDDDAFAAAWNATREEGEPWVLSFKFPFRGRSHVARWEFDPRTREVTPLNKLALDIGWVAPARAAAASRKPRAKAKRASKPAPKRKAAAKKKGTARRKPAAKRKPVKRKPAARRKPVKRKAAKRRR